MILRQWVSTCCLWKNCLTCPNIFLVTTAKVNVFLIWDTWFISISTSISVILLTRCLLNYLDTDSTWLRMTLAFEFRSNDDFTWLHPSFFHLFYISSCKLLQLKLRNFCNPSSHSLPMYWRRYLCERFLITVLFEEFWSVIRGVLKCYSRSSEVLFEEFWSVIRGVLHYHTWYCKSSVVMQPPLALMISFIWSSIPTSQCQSVVTS